MTDADDVDAVRRLLAEAGLEDEDALTPVVLELRALRGGPPPAPSAAVAALMTGRPRRRAGRAGVVVTLAVTASLGAGLTAAAASPAIRDRAASAVAALGSPRIQSPALPAVEEASPARSTRRAAEDGDQRSAGTSAPSTTPAPLESVVPGDDRRSSRQGSERDDRAATPAPSRSAEASDSHRHGSGSSGRGGDGSPSSGRNADPAKDDGKRSDDARGTEAAD